jgi:hypothetical protein
MVRYAFVPAFLFLACGSSDGGASNPPPQQGLPGVPPAMNAPIPSVVPPMAPAIDPPPLPPVPTAVMPAMPPAMMLPSPPAPMMPTAQPPAPPVPGYHDVSTPSNWHAMPLAGVGIAVPTVEDPRRNYERVGFTNFAGGVFDGRFVYLVPQVTTDGGGPDGVTAVVRYDTTTSIDAPSSWSAFDLHVLSELFERPPFQDVLDGFTGGVYDGRYLYLAPSSGTVVLTYDTQAPFDAKSSWSTFDTAVLSAPCPSAGNSPGLGQYPPSCSTHTSFAGAVFDGRYVYFVPLFDYALISSQVTRYDTKLPFTARTAWSTFDTTSVHKDAYGFTSGVFDGTYLYLLPFGAEASDIAMRFDTRRDFADRAAWTAFDLSRGSVAFPTSPSGGAVFDGQSLYFLGTSAADHSIVQFDTRSKFDDPKSWAQPFYSDALSKLPDFWGGAFDGRFVYFVPGGFEDDQRDAKLMARYDTMGTTHDATAWTTLDTTTIDREAHHFHGAVFDGEYLYFVPHAGATLVRFDARYPRSVPPTVYGGSFR